MWTVKSSMIAALLLLLVPAAHAADIKAGDLVLSDPWSRATPKGATVAAGYLTIRNQGQAPDRLVAASSTLGAKADMHGEIIGAGLADGGREDLDDPEDRSDLRNLVQQPSCAKS